MSYEEKDMSGVLYVNDRKEKDSHPDYKGRGLINGKKVWISGWKKRTENGTLLSLSFQPREDRQEQASRSTPPPRQAPKRNAYAERDDDYRDVPF